MFEEINREIYFLDTTQDLGYGAHSLVLALPGLLARLRMCSSNFCDSCPDDGGFTPHRSDQSWLASTNHSHNPQRKDCNRKQQPTDLEAFRDDVHDVVADVLILNQQRLEAVYAQDAPPHTHHRTQKHQHVVQAIASAAVRAPYLG